MSSQLPSYQAITDLIMNDEIANAVSKLSLLISGNDFADSNLIESLHNIESQYSAMLRAYASGFPDAERSRNIGNIKESLYLIADSMRRNEMIARSHNAYASAVRFEELQKSTLPSRLRAYDAAWNNMQKQRELSTADNSNSQEYDEALEGVFNKVFTLYKPDKEEVATLSERLKNDLRLDLCAQIVSALTLGLLVFYDKKRFYLLLEASRNENSVIAARAMIGALLVSRKYSMRLASDRDVADNLSHWNDNVPDLSRIRTSILSIVSAYGTQQISDKLQNELIPDLMKLRPDLMEKMKDIDPENPMASLEQNPEWEDILEKSGITDKMQQLAELQEEGADIMIAPFSQMKNYPFFRRLANWTLPFSASHHDISAGDSINVEIASILSENPVICDSDKYSMALSLKNIPSAQKNMLKTQFEMQKEQLMEETKSKLLKMSEPDFENEARNFVRNLYRLFRLSPFAKDFRDPFAKPFDFSKLPVVGEILSTEDLYQLLFEFYFRHGFYEEALPMLESLKSRGMSDYSIYEKEGFCRQMLGDIKGALDAYSKASLLSEESMWLIKKIAYCSRLLKDYTLAAEYYSKVAEAEPQNYMAILNEALCRAENGETDEALKLYYKVAYLDSLNLKALRGIALTEAANDNFEKSISYFSRLVKATRSAENLADFAAVALLSERRNMVQSLLAEAVSIAIGKNGFSRDEALESVAKMFIDSVIWNNREVNKSDLRLLAEGLWYL